MRRLVGGVLLLGLLGGCAVSGGRAVVTPPGVVVEPPVYHWHWAAWPHYDVEHRSIVEHRVVIERDHHYYPFYDRVHGRHDNGKHEGWHKHDRDDD